ncbi:MAG TPA: hypothetical protein VGC89_02310 [Pyrinomonadaceae bacterium]
MESTKKQKAQPRAITVARINAKQAIVIAIIGLMATLGAAFLTNRLSTKEAAVTSASIKEQIAYSKGRHSIVQETMERNLKTVREFKAGIRECLKCEDSKGRQWVEAAMNSADKMEEDIKEQQEKSETHYQESLAKLSQGDEIAANDSKAKANAVIREKDEQLAAENRRLAALVTTRNEATTLIPETVKGTFDLKQKAEPTKIYDNEEYWKTESCGGVGARQMERAAIPLTPTPEFGKTKPNQVNAEQVAALADKSHKLRSMKAVGGYISPASDKGGLRNHNLVHGNSRADFNARSLNSELSVEDSERQLKTTPAPGAQSSLRVSDLPPILTQR